MSETPRLEAMTAREIGAGLMRGNRAELKRGFSWQNAHEAVLRLRTLDADQAAALQMYLRGFAFGMADREPEGAYMELHGGAYADGWNEGRAEPRERVLPAVE